jgi:hypothetical protein
LYSSHSQREFYLFCGFDPSWRRASPACRKLRLTAASLPPEGEECAESNAIRGSDAQKIRQRPGLCWLDGVVCVRFTAHLNSLFTFWRKKSALWASCQY